jgi:hypothetical protein
MGLVMRRRAPEGGASPRADAARDVLRGTLDVRRSGSGAVSPAAESGREVAAPHGVPASRLPRRERP